ncbi:MAG: hypothetical protein WBO10_11965 [Pyrinomonadaceae bacterium]
MEHMRVAVVFAICISIFACSCGANEGVLKSGRETPAQTNPVSSKTDFARELEDIQNANFIFVYVLRRKDGGPMDSEDRSVIRTNTVDMNRRVAADNDKAFIIGSNYQMPPKNLIALDERFALENLSTTTPPNSNSDSNTNK